jgi:hypothetical protein
MTEKWRTTPMHVPTLRSILYAIQQHGDVRPLVLDENGYPVAVINGRGEVSIVGAVLRHAGRLTDDEIRSADRLNQFFIAACKKARVRVEIMEALEDVAMNADIGGPYQWDGFHAEIADFIESQLALCGGAAAI